MPKSRVTGKASSWITALADLLDSAFRGNDGKKAEMPSFRNHCSSFCPEICY